MNISEKDWNDGVRKLEKMLNTDPVPRGTLELMTRLDMYAAFHIKKVPNSSLIEEMIAYDGAWSRKGSDRIARYLAHFATPERVADTKIFFEMTTHGALAYNELYFTEFEKLVEIVQQGRQLWVQSYAADYVDSIP